MRLAALPPLLALLAACDAPPADRPAVWAARFREPTPATPNPPIARFFDVTALHRAATDELAPGLPAATPDGALVAVVIAEPAPACACPVLTLQLLDGRTGLPRESIPLLNPVEGALVARGGPAAAAQLEAAGRRLSRLDERLQTQDFRPLESLGLEQAALSAGEDAAATIDGRRFVWDDRRSALQIEEAGVLVAAARLPAGLPRAPGCAGVQSPPLPAAAHRLADGRLLLRATYAGDDLCAPPADVHRIVKPLPRGGTALATR